MKPYVSVLIMVLVWSSGNCANTKTGNELLPPLSLETADMTVELAQVTVQSLPSGKIQTLVPVRKANQTRVYVFREHKLKTVLTYPFNLEFIGTPSDLSRLLFTEPGTDPLTGKPDVSYRITKGNQPGNSRLMRQLTAGETRWFAPSIPDSRLLTWAILETGKGITEIGITGDDEKKQNVTFRFGERSSHCACYLVNDRTGELTLSMANGTLLQQGLASKKTRWGLEPEQIGHKILALYPLGNDSILCDHGDGNLTQIDVLKGTITNRFNLNAIRKQAGTGELCLSPEVMNITGQFIIEEHGDSLVIYHRLEQDKLVRLGQHAQPVGISRRHIPVIDKNGQLRIFCVSMETGKLLMEECPLE